MGFHAAALSEQFGTMTKQHCSTQAAIAALIKKKLKPGFFFTSMEYGTIGDGMRKGIVRIDQDT